VKRPLDRARGDADPDGAKWTRLAGTRLLGPEERQLSEVWVTTEEQELIALLDHAKRELGEDPSRDCFRVGDVERDVIELLGLRRHTRGLPPRPRRKRLREQL
jgi:hypothetical protein